MCEGKGGIPKTNAITHKKGIIGVGVGEQKVGPDKWISRVLLVVVGGG